MTKTGLNIGFAYMSGKHCSIVARNLSVFAEVKPLLRNINLSIHPGVKTALIGRNGSGKSTLLTIIYCLAAAKKPPDYIRYEGEIFVSPDARVGYLPQDVQIVFSGTVGEYFDAQSPLVSKTVNRYEELTGIFRSRNGTDKEMSEYCALLDKMSELGGWDYARQRLQIVEGCGLSNKHLDLKIRQVSGGEAAKIALAGIMLNSPNLILLDEPTNNLDPQVQWFLERWIKETNVSLFIISHDREFLNRVISEIIEIDEHTLGTTIYGGNYSFYEAKREEMFKTQQKQYDVQQRKRRQLEEDAKRLQFEAKSFDNTSIDSFYRSKGARIAKRASAQLARIERDLEKLSAPCSPKKPKITILNPIVSGPTRLLQANRLSFSYQNEINIIRSLSITICSGDRIAIIGANSTGKTTLLKLLVGELKPSEGNLYLKEGAKIAYLQQTPDLTGTVGSLLDFLMDRTGLKYEQACQILGQFLFLDPAHAKQTNLSVGEMRKIELAGIFAMAPDAIVLDEPTNHLDIYTIKEMEKALKEFRGTLIAVSHDLMFLKNMGVQRLIIITPTGMTELSIKQPGSLERAFNKSFAVGRNDISGA